MPASTYIEPNVDVTAWGALIVITHDVSPLQSPDQPLKSEPLESCGVSVTAVPYGKSAEHVAVQSMPDGLLVTEAPPVPANVTVNVLLVGIHVSVTTPEGA